MYTSRTFVVPSPQEFVAEICSLHPRSPLVHRPSVDASFYGPFDHPKNSQEWSAIGYQWTLAESLARATQFFAHLGEDFQAQVRSTLDRAIYRRYGNVNIPERVSWCDLVTPIEKILADAHKDWIPGQSNATLGVARAILWFLLDTVSTPGVEQLARHLESPLVMRALIERDPVFSDSTELSTRAVNLDHLTLAFTRFDYKTIFQLVVARSFISRYVPQGEPGWSSVPFADEHVRVARQLLAAYKLGKDLPNVEPRILNVLVDLGFVRLNPMRLRQADIDKDWLNECLTRIFTASTNVAHGHSRNAIQYNTADDLAAAAAVCSLVVYNRCSTSSRVLDQLQSSCRFRSTNPFTTDIDVHPDQGSSNNVFIIRAAHFSTFSALTTKLREMYSDGLDGAPLYARHASMRGVREDPPRLILEVDPLFSSGLLVWLESYREALDRAHRGTVFYCIVNDPQYDPTTLGPNPKPRDVFASITYSGVSNGATAETIELTRERTVEWLRKNCRREDELPPDVKIHTSIGQWLVERRQNPRAGEPAELFVSSKALEDHKDNWRLALYIFTQGTGYDLAVVDDNPGSLVDRLFGIVPVASSK